MKTLFTKSGEEVLLDDDDFDVVSRNKWHIYSAKLNKRYACRLVNGKKILMHRFILNAPSGFMVDHIDGNTLNNQKSNLRLCNNTQNLHNRSAGKNSKTGYKGVFPFRKKYMASIMCNGKKTYLGLFDDPVSGAIAYDNAARELFGEFARLNFPAHAEKTQSKKTTKSNAN